MENIYESVSESASRADLVAFLQFLKEKDNKHNEISGMKNIYLIIQENDYQTIDVFIEKFIEFDFSFQFHISMLAGTLNIKNKLKNREKLVDDSKRLASKEYINSSLFQGLIDK